MEELNIKELVDYVKERILLIAIITLVVLVAGCAYSIFLKTPMYRSDTTLVLVSDDGKSSGNSSYSQTDATLNKNLVSTYSEIIKSRRILEKVIENLSLDYSYSSLKSMVSVTNTTNTEIIKITVVNPDKALAANVVNEIIKVFGQEIKDIYKLQNVSVVDKGKEAESPYNINVARDIIIYLFVGFVLACAIIFIVFYFDTTIKSTDEIEKKLGLPVLGVVPKVKQKGKK